MHGEKFQQTSTCRQDRLLVVHTVHWENDGGSHSSMGEGTGRRDGELEWWAAGVEGDGWERWASSNGGGGGSLHATWNRLLPGGRGKLANRRETSTHWRCHCVCTWDILNVGNRRSAVCACIASAFVFFSRPHVQWTVLPTPFNSLHLWRHARIRETWGTTHEFEWNVHTAVQERGEFLVAEIGASDGLPVTTELYRLYLFSLRPTSSQSRQYWRSGVTRSCSAQRCRASRGVEGSLFFILVLHKIEMFERRGKPLKSARHRSSLYERCALIFQYRWS